ncbi:hypothetical protein B0T10DRAFT_465027 [Thelonectria olida]|uniref:Uncharacterized protein n=1 Tax=Thelonectria olida TaxID=1576542 RepID=A0A9P8VWM7_9HYPO|nr:hypothetical protein B0T10DRAFT_465027 [Thelonectria olida]
MVPAPQSLLHRSYWLRKTKGTHTHALLAKSLHPPTRADHLKPRPLLNTWRNPLVKQAYRLLLQASCRKATQRKGAANLPTSPSFQPSPGGRALSPVPPPKFGPPPCKITGLSERNCTS